MKRHLSIGFLLLSTFVIAGCPSGATGDACETADDCADGQCIVGGSFPEGVCTPMCNTNADCPDDFSCISRSSGICLQNCDSTAFCEDLRGEAWQCRDESLEDGGGNAMVCIGD
jgi:hypothetical protein